jgi:hypothetical protein
MGDQSIYGFIAKLGPCGHRPGSDVLLGTWRHRKTAIIGQ